ncbi:hypothetical protein FJU30_26120 [Affinibrenneria salicis]|uniref:Uncharacterized protein n=1 Tax=Affinibrenneria salicis TaxID=2590031 RepID=A0A5J5FQB4_9GAMM|nr:hypothetical protein [Affinibrenneria salicis]KAA8994641.1 hypothetical protein FJU30_26120 [Affinibrenneria salicis]
MANADSNTNTYHDSLPNTDCLYSAMRGALADLDFSAMDDDARMLAADYCEGTRAGLCHCLNFIGDTLVTFADNQVHEFTPASLCQLGHSLISVSLLIPALTDLQQRAEAPARRTTD